MTITHRRRRSLLALIGIGILAFALHAIGGTAVVDAAKRCHPAAVFVASAAIMTGTVLGALNSYFIAELRGTMPFWQFLLIYWRSWAIGISLPGQVADFLSTLWQLKGRSSELGLVAGRLLIDKVITFGLTLALAALLPLLVGATDIRVALLLLGLILSAVTVGWWLVGWAVANLRAPFRHPWISRVLSVALAARSTPPHLAVANALVTLGKLALSGVAYWVVLRSIDAATPPLLTTTAIAQSAGLVAYLPLSFNGLGTVEVSAVGLFRMVGLNEASVLSAYLILRVAILASAWIPATVTMFANMSHDR